MSKINFKCFGDNIYSVISSTIIQYTTLPIEKESFITQIKSGLVQYSNIQLRNGMPINFQNDYYCTSMSLNLLKMTIPDDKETFTFNGDGLSLVIELHSLDFKEIDLHLKEMINDLTKAFIDKAVFTVEKTNNKQQPSFWDNITEKMYTCLIDGMRLYLSNVKVIYKNNDDLLEFTIDEIDYKQGEGVTLIKGLKWVLKSEENKAFCVDIIDKCSLRVYYDKLKHLMQFNIDEMRLNYDRRIYEAFDRWDMVKQSNITKEKFYKKKLLVEYYKDSDDNSNNNGKRNYMKLWYYAIKTVIRLKKYNSNSQVVNRNNYSIFNLIPSTYNKMAKKYYNRKDDTEISSNILILKLKTLLQLSQFKAEEIIIANKSKASSNPLMAFLFKKPSIANNTNNTISKPILSQEEQTKLNNFYTIKSIEQFLNSRWYKSTFLLEKYDLLMERLTLDFSISKLHLTISNSNDSLKLILLQLHMNIIQNDKGEFTSNYTMHIGDIKSNYENGLIQGKTKDNVITINSIEYEEEIKKTISDAQYPITKVKMNSMINFDFGFNELILNRELVTFFIGARSMFINNEERWVNVFEKNKTKIRTKIKTKTRNEDKEDITITNQGEYNFGIFPHLVMIDQNITAKAIIHGITIEDYCNNNNSSNTPTDIPSLSSCFNNGKMYLIDLEIQEIQNKINLLSRTIIQINHIKMINNENSYEKYSISFIDNISLTFNETLLIYLNKLKEISNSFKRQYDINQYCNPINNNHTTEVLFKFDIVNNVYQSLMLEIQLSKISISFIEEYYISSLTMKNIKGIVKGDQIELYIEEQFVTFDKNSKFFILLSNPTTFISNDTINNNITHQHNTKPFNLIILIKQSALDFNVNDTFKIQGISENIKISHNSNNIAFTSEKSLITYHDKRINSTIHLLELLKELKISYSTLNNTLICHIENPLINLTLPIFIQLTSLYSSKHNQNERLDLKKNHFLLNINIIKPKLKFNRLICQMDMITFAVIGQQLIYNLQCSNFIMSNEVIELITEERLIIAINLNDYPKNVEIAIDFKLLKISLSQMDITNLINALDYKSNDKPNEYDALDQLIALSHKDNDININDTYSNPNGNITIIKLSINLPSSTIKFCLTTYEPILSTDLQNTNINFLFNGKAVEYEAKITQIEAFFVDCQNNTFNLISSNSSPTSHSLLIDYEIKHQLNISYKDSFCSIDVSSLKFILRIDAILCMNSYFKNAIPVRKIYNQVKELKAEMKVKCILANTAYVLQTSFDNKENFFIQVEKMNAVYQNTIKDKFPFGKLFIEITAFLGEFVNRSKRRKLINSKSDFLLIKAHHHEKGIEVNVMLYKLSMSLSYKDIIAFSKGYYLNMYFMKNEVRFKTIEKNSDLLHKENQPLTVQHEVQYKKQLSNTSISDFFNVSKNKDKEHSKGEIKESVLNIPETTSEEPEPFEIKIMFETEKSEITLIDNHNNSYSPFLNFVIEKVDCAFENWQTTITYEPSIYCYNYISCTWEPTLEPVPVKLLYTKTNFQDAQKQALSFIINNNILINLSDMNISLLLTAFDRWMLKYKAEKESFQTFIDEITSKENHGKNIPINDLTLSSDQPISNNKVYNCTGDFFNINYKGKTYQCTPDSKTDLEYINNEDDATNNNSKSPSQSKRNLIKMNKIKEIELVYYQGEKLGEYKVTCPLEKIGTRIYRMEKSSDYFVSEISLTKELTMEIKFYSPLIFYNKTALTITIVFSNDNEKETDQHIMILESRMKKGVPLRYYNNGSFNVYLNYYGQDNNQGETKGKNRIKNAFDVKKIIHTNYNGGNYHQHITIENRHMQLKMVSTIANVRQVVISFEYILLNCLPCPIIMLHDNKETEIPQSSHYEIDFKCNKIFSFIINIGHRTYKSMRDCYFDKNDKEGFLTFTNQETATSFQLPMLILNKSTQKALVIYADYLLKNISGLLMGIESKSKEKNPLCFPISQDVYLLSSNTDMKGWFSLRPNGDYKSEKIYLKELLSRTSDYYVHMANEHKESKSLSTRFLDLNIRTSDSHLPKTIFSDTNILTTCIITIQPICQIYNLMKEKAFFICSANHKDEVERFPPMTKQGFHFFHRGRNLKFCLGIGSTSASNPTEWSEPFSITKSNYYTCCLQMNIFNVELRQNTEENITDIFIFESTKDNSKTIIDNQTDFNITVHPKGMPFPKQIIKAKTKEQYRLYSLYNTVLTYIVNGISHECSLTLINEPHCEYFSSLPPRPSNIPVENDLVLYTESNGFITHLIFYEIENNEKMLPEASCRFLDLNFSSVLITFIGDNEAVDKKLRNYTRNEIVLIELRNISLVVFEKKNRSLLNKKSSDCNFTFGTIKVYNQISSIGKYATVFYNNSSPAIEGLMSHDYYPIDNMMSLNSLNLQLKDFSIGIDPNFIQEIILFLNNIIYRMNLKNFDVDDVFLIDSYLYDIKSEYYKEQLIKEHKSNSALCSIRNIELPTVNFTIELSKIGLKKLLKSQFNFSSMASSILSNLAGEVQPLKLPKMRITNSGALGAIISDIRHRYHRQIIGQFNGIGFKGLLLGFANIFKQKEHESNAVKYERMRLPRAFYGRFKSFQRYDYNHAVIVGNLKDINVLMNGYQFVDGVIMKSGTVVFTTLAMLLFNLNYVVLYDINYVCVKEVILDKNELFIVYNQLIDKRDMRKITFENDANAENVCKKLRNAIEEHAKEFDNLN